MFTKHVVVILARSFVSRCSSLSLDYSVYGVDDCVVGQDVPVDDVAGAGLGGHPDDATLEHLGLDLLTVLEGVQDLPPDSAEEKGPGDDVFAEDRVQRVLVGLREGGQRKS